MDGTMNSSFRTAFRVLVLSLFIPLTAVVLAELLPGTFANPVLADRTTTVSRLTAQAPPRGTQPTGADIARSNANGNRSTAPDIATTDQNPRAVTPSGTIPARTVSRSNVAPTPWSPDELQPKVIPAPRHDNGQPRSGRKPAVLLQPIEDDAVDADAAYPRLGSHLNRLQRSLDLLAQNQNTSQQINQATQLLQQLQNQNKLSQLEAEIKDLKAQAAPVQPQINPPPAVDANPASTTGSTSDPSNPATSTDESADNAKPTIKNASEVPETDDMLFDDLRAPKAAGAEAGPAVKPIITKGRPTTDGEERFTLQLRDAEISTVLEMLGEFSGINILAGKDVVGRVTFNLHDVTIDEALDAILKVGNYTYTKEGNFIYVTSTLAAEAKAKLARKIIVKVYRPYYISAADFRVLVQPIMTPSIGKISVTTPNQTGIPSGADQAGGDSLTQRDAILVQDYPEVIQEIDNILKEMDIPPTQVVIDAVVLSVKLNDSLKLGVNFALLNRNGNQLVTSGNGQTLNSTTGIPGGATNSIVPAMGEFIANTSGLKYGFIRGDISLFINALESIADTNLVANPQLIVLNKQRAELIIGERLSYKTLAFNGTQTAENVNFLDAGTKLRIRPFIAPDGLVRMELHPERSSATINATTQLPNLSTTEVTTNVMVKDGTTVVIGGLIEEQVDEQYDRVPFLGGLPLIGPVFRNKTESTVRNELIVLITPRIVRVPNDDAGGFIEHAEGVERHDYFRDKLEAVNRRNLARTQFEKAQDCYEHGDYERAWHHINDCLAHSKNDRRALQLKKQIEQVRRPRFWPWNRSAAPPVEPPPLEPPPAPSSLENQYDEPISLPGASIKPATQAAAPFVSRPQPKRLTARAIR
jgi:type IV pilus assembly protein PilQ